MNEKRDVSLYREGILRGMVDVHTHLMFGVDDGAKTQKEMIDIIGRLKTVGIERAFATPHLMPRFPNNTKKSLRKRFENLAEPTAKSVGFELRLGGEYLACSDLYNTLRSHERLLTYRDNIVLVEYSRKTPPVHYFRHLQEIIDSGYSVVLAHPERYYYFNEDIFNKFKEMGIKFQLNLLSLIGAYGPVAKIWAYEFLNSDMYTYVASDVHSEAMVEKLKSIKVYPHEAEKIKKLIANNNELWEE